MKVFPVNTPKGRQTIVSLDTTELAEIIAEAVGKKIGIDINQLNVQWHFLGETHYAQFAVGIDFLEKP